MRTLSEVELLSLSYQDLHRMSNQFREKYDELMNRAFRLYRRVLLTKLFVMKYFRKSKRELKTSHTDRTSILSDDFYSIEPFELEQVLKIESDEFMSSETEEKSSDSKSGTLESIDEES